jgi:hypothetical protein
MFASRHPNRPIARPHRHTPRLIRLLPLFALLVLALASTSALRAQAVHWENGDSPLGTTIQLVFEDCAPDGEPQLPSIPGAALSRVGESTSLNAVNGDVSRTVTLTYVVQARRSGPVQIPAFTVKTTKGELRVPEFNSAAPAITADSVASSKLIPERTSVWAGEVFGLTYQLTAARRNNPQVNPTFDWNPSPLIAEDWSKFEISEGVVNGQREATLTCRTRVYAKAPNTLKLEPATHLLNIQTGSVNFGFIPQPRMEPVSVTSDQPVIEVRPLPAAPAGFSGAVGQFKLAAKVVPQKAGVGEPITWTLELTGTGNWPDIDGLPAREVSKDFQVVQPKAKRTPAEGKLFDATLTEDVVLVPTKPGRYTLGPVSFTYFDPRSGAYKTLRTDSTTITVTPPAAPSLSTPATNGAAPAAAADTEPPAAPAKPLVAPAAPAGIPRDPLPGSDLAARPLTAATFIAWLIAPLVGLVAFWVFLAWRRAAATDPLRPQREAKARLATLLAGMRAKVQAGHKPAPAQLLEWQHDSAILWQVRHAAPPPAAVGDIEWTALWRDSDQALYGARNTLPPDWIARAEAAVAGKHVPPFRPVRLFLPQNLLPFAAMVVVGLALAASGLHAASPEAAYRSGDFAAAEKAWREAVAQHPTDWIARHNLALALAQQDRTGEAAAEAAAAYVQNPANASVRWHFGLMAGKTAFAPGPLVPFLKEGPVAEIAGITGPAGWQRIVILAAFVVAVALAWMLLNAYGRRERVQFWLAGAMGALAFLIGAVGIFGFVAYRETADTRAAVAWRAGTLRSIPTEADTSQKTTTLSAGSVAIVDRTFLGWTHLQFPNGQTGWVRKDDLIPLWR